MLSRNLVLIANGTTLALFQNVAAFLFNGIQEFLLGNTDQNFRYKDHFSGFKK